MFLVAGWFVHMAFKSSNFQQLNKSKGLYSINGDGGPDFPGNTE